MVLEKHTQSCGRSCKIIVWYWLLVMLRPAYTPLPTAINMQDSTQMVMAWVYTELCEMPRAVLMDLR